MRWADATHTGEGFNPLCGDRVKIYLHVDAAGRIADIGFEGKGCAISQASASLMSDMLIGRTVDEADRLMGGFLHLVKGEDAAELQGDDRDRLDVMAGVSAYPMRVKCATLAWHTMKSALEGGSPAQERMNAEPNNIETSALAPDVLEAFTAKLVAALKSVYDPEIPVDIYELGLIYKVDVADNMDVTVDMTLTAPACPVAGEMPVMVKTALEGVEGIGAVTST